MRKTFTFGCLLFSVSLAGFLGIAEIILRMAGISFPRFYQSDPELGFRLRANEEGWFRSEGRTYIRINRHGWRDREHSERKPESTMRIAVVGDSFAEALQVAQEDTFWAIMEQQLQQRGCWNKKRVEVLNFGVSGYGTAQEKLVLQQHVWQYEPDIIVLAMFPGNDIRNNSPSLEPQKRRPFFRLHDGALCRETAFLAPLPAPSPLKAKLSEFCYRRFRLYQLASAIKKQLIALHEPAFSPAVMGDEPGVDTAIYREPATPEWKDAWNITEALLLSIAQDAERHQAHLLVALISPGIRTHPDIAVRRGFLRHFELDDFEYADRRLTGVLMQAGIPVLALAPIFRQYAEERHLLLHGFENAMPGFGHWNQAGHRLAGETLAAYVCDHFHE